MKSKTLVFIGLNAALAIYLAFHLAANQWFDLEYQAQTQSCLTEPGMVLISGAAFNMGAGAVYPEETPIVRTKVESFYMSRHEVTNAEFMNFVNATGYITVAERIIDPTLHPNIPPEQLKPGSAVFVKLSEAVAATTFMNWWHFREGASWKHPMGPDSNIQGKAHYPVIHIAYEDAMEYSKWKGHRLPTEAEYEYASRGGIKDAKYASGNSLTKNGKYLANTWQGLFPFNDTAEDGYVGLAPVGCFPPNSYGLYDLIGNVWEWTDTAYYPQHFKIGNVPANLPPEGFDNRQSGVPVGVIKGGSYLCAEDFCMRYRPAARHAQDTGLGTSHIGFRTVKDI
jgi:formylglycine-generating enzyme required for sulfatase activity